MPANDAVQSSDMRQTGWGYGLSLARELQFEALMAMRGAVSLLHAMYGLPTMQHESAILGRWWRGRPNWGDSANPILINKLSGKAVQHAGWNLGSRPVYSVIGSVLDNAAEPCLEVWGSGFMHADSPVACPPRKVHAVRGPLTRARLLSMGIECPKVFGDPGLLYPALFGHTRRSKGKLAIVPHFADRGSALVERLEKKYDLVNIDVQADVDQVVQLVAECDWIASSSLHGLVIADALKIPNTWIQISNNVMGNGFKFLDYFSGVGRPPIDAVQVTSQSTLDDLMRQAHTDPITFSADDLLEVCPFRIS